MCKCFAPFMWWLGMHWAHLSGEPWTSAWMIIFYVENLPGEFVIVLMQLM